MSMCFILWLSIVAWLSIIKGLLFVWLKILIMYSHLKRTSTSSISGTDSDSEDEIVMVKCKRFTFGPKDNKVVNFCYSFDSSSSSESENEEAKEEAKEMKGEGLNTHLNAEPVTPVTSSEEIAVASIERPKTPNNQISSDDRLTSSSPLTPEEVKMLRGMKISRKNGRYLIEKDHLIEIRRKELQLDAERRNIREQESNLILIRQNLELLEHQCLQRFEQLMAVELAYRAQRERELEEHFMRMVAEREMTVRNEMGARICEMEVILMQERAMRENFIQEQANNFIEWNNPPQQMDVDKVLRESFCNVPNSGSSRRELRSISKPSNPVNSKNNDHNNTPDNQIQSSATKTLSIEDIQTEMLETEDKKSDAFSILKTIPNVFNSMFGGGKPKHSNLEDDI